MNKQQFIDHHRNLMIHQQEIERKWRVHVREQEELALLQEAHLRLTISDTGGGLGGLAQDYMEYDYMIDTTEYIG